MVAGVLNCGKPLLWAGVIIGTLTLMTAILIIQLVSEHLSQVERTERMSDGGRDVYGFVEENFRSVARTMYTLFLSLTGGIEWGDIAKQFEEMSSQWGVYLNIALVGYITLGTYCMLNLVTAVFLEAAHRTDDVQEMIYAKQDFVQTTKEFFLAAMEDFARSNRIVATGSSFRARASMAKQRLAKADFMSILKRRSTVQFLEENGVDLAFEGRSRLEDLFSLMDDDGNGFVDINEFVVNLYQMKGPARALDVKLELQKVLRKITVMQGALHQFEKAVAGNPTPRPLPSSPRP